MSGRLVGDIIGVPNALHKVVRRESARRSISERA